MEKIEKSFDDLKKIFATKELAEKLISKKYIFDLQKKKIESISIQENIIQCTYSPDSLYTFTLIFERNSINQIDFSLTIPSGIFIDIVHLATLTLKPFVKQGVVERINKRWDEVNNL